MKKRILNVDADTFPRNELVEFLKQADYDMTVTADGSEAIDRYLEPLDLLLLDINIPGRDRWAAFEHITWMDSYVATILMSKLDDQFPIASGVGAGALLEKPLDLGELLRVAEELLAEPRVNYRQCRQNWRRDTSIVPFTKYVGARDPLHNLSIAGSSLKLSHGIT